MPNSSKETIIWLDNRPELSPEISRLAQDNGYKLQICTGVAEFYQALEAYKERPGDIAAFILEKVISLEEAADLQALQEMIPGIQGGLGVENNVGPLLSMRYLRENNKSIFFRTPILFHTVIQFDTRGALHKIANASRFSEKGPEFTESGISYAVKPLAEEMPDYLQELEAWFSSLKAA